MSIRSPPEAPCDTNTNRLAAVLRAGMQADAKGGGALPSLGRLSVCKTGPPVKRDVEGKEKPPEDAGGKEKPPEKLERRTKQVLSSVLSEYVLEMSGGGMMLPGTNFDLDAGTHASLMSYAGSRDYKQFKAGIRGQLPFLTRFEVEMVEMGMVVYSKYSSLVSHTGVFIFSATKLKTLAEKAPNFEFAMKSLLWVLSHIPNNELVGAILQAEDKISNTRIRNEPVWHKLLDQYKLSYNDAKQYCEAIAKEAGIDTSGMFDATVDVRFVYGVKSLDNQYNATSMKRPNAPLGLLEQEIKNKAVTVEGMILDKLSKINEARMRDGLSPKKRDEMSYDDEREILVAHWNPFVKQRALVSRELRSYVELGKSPYKQRLKIQVAAPAAQPM